MHYYKRNLGDYAKKAGRLSMLQHGAYTLLIDACYDREQFPTMQDAIDWTWASSAAEIEAVEFVLAKFFTLIDGRYVQHRISEELGNYHATSETNKRIAIDREAKRKESLTNRARSVNGAPPNQEPRTSNQEPVTKEEAKASKDAFIAPDWVPSEQWGEFVSMRKAMRNVPFTLAAAKGVVGELDRLRTAGHDPGEMLMLAVTNGWRTVYPPKTSFTHSAPKNTGRHSGFDQIDYTTGIHSDGTFA